MNLNVHNWKPFKIGSLFHVLRGHDLELVNCEESYDDNSVAFVSRSAYNNGVTAKIQRIEGIEPLAAGLISVAGSGSSTLSTFVQPEPFYTGFHMFALEAKEIVSFEAKMFVTRIIETNKYKYCYGRQADKTISLLEINLPIRYDGNNEAILDSDCSYSDEGYIPDWQFMEDYIKSLQYKPLTTHNESLVIQLDFSTWREFVVSSIFAIHNGKCITIEEIEEHPGDLAAIQSGEDNNGVIGKIDINYCQSQNYTICTSPCLTVARTGSAGFVSFQKHGCVVGDSAKILRLKYNHESTGLYLFLQTLLSKNRFKYAYGRKVTENKYMCDTIYLPVQYQNGKPLIDETKNYSQEGYVPDWDYMENYIKNLPYGDRI